MELPKAVREQEEKAEELRKRVYEGGDTETPELEAAPEEEVAEEETEEEEEASLAVNEVANLQAELDRAQSALSTLQGKYDNEVPRYAQEVRELREMVSSREEPKKEADPSELLSSMKETFGDEFASELDAYLDARVGKRVANLEGQINSVANATTQTAKGMFFDTLDSMVPEWKQIKDMPEFKKYLDVPDPFSGKTRFDLAMEAQEALDARRVASFYQAFKDTNPSMKKKKKPKGKLVAPNGSNKAGVGEEAEVEFVTRDEIKRFYDDMRRGVFKGREDEANRIEGLINKAIAERRVV